MCDVDEEFEQLEFDEEGSKCDHCGVSAVSQAVFWADDGYICSPCQVAEFGF